MVRLILILLCASPAYAHQVPVMTCDLTEIATKSPHRLVLGYDEHDVSFPMQLGKGPVIKLKGGRVDGGEAFAGDAADGPITLDIPQNAPARLVFGHRQFEGTCRR